MNDTSHRVLLEDDAEREDASLAGDEPESAQQEAAPVEGGRPGRGRRLGVIALIAVTVALAALTVTFAVEARQNAADRERRTEVLEAARERALNLISLDATNVEQRTRALIDGSTGEFRRQFEGAAPTFVDVVRQGQVHSAGTIDEAGVQKVDEHQARVLLAASAQISNTQARNPETRRYRLTVDLTYEQNRWLISKMEFVP